MVDWRSEKTRMETDRAFTTGRRFLLLLIFSLASGLGEVFRVDIDSLIEGIMEGGAFYGIWDMAAGLLLSFVAISGLVGLLVRIFVLNPMEVGVYRFFMESRAEGFSVGVSRILYAFSSGSYGNIVKIMFFRDLFLFFVDPSADYPGNCQIL